MSEEEAMMLPVAVPASGTVTVSEVSDQEVIEEVAPLIVTEPVAEPK